MPRGYSDRINHAFAFAAKHHDRQVRKGTRLPYLTHPANVAVILTRYGQEEQTIVADLKRTLDPDTVWSRFSAGRLGTVRWYRRVYDRLRELGFDTPIMTELRDVAEELEQLGAGAGAR